jgi:hypothetical protein
MTSAPPAQRKHHHTGVALAAGTHHFCHPIGLPYLAREQGPADSPKMPCKFSHLASTHQTSKMQANLLPGREDAFLPAQQFRIASLTVSLPHVHIYARIGENFTTVPHPDGAQRCRGLNISRPSDG